MFSYSSTDCFFFKVSPAHRPFTADTLHTLLVSINYRANYCYNLQIQKKVILSISSVHLTITATRLYQFIIMPFHINFDYIDLAEFLDYEIDVEM